MGLCDSENKMKINTLINGISERDGRNESNCSKAKKKKCFKNYFLVWGFHFIFRAWTRLAWTMYCNTRFEFFQEQASTSSENHYSLSASGHSLGPQLLLLAPTEVLQVLWKADLEPYLIISNSMRGSRISCGCDDQGLLDHSANSAKAMQTLEVKKERFHLPHLGS